ncbi:unnamed protein product, partial [Laminaria digitata]
RKRSSLCAHSSLLHRIGSKDIGMEGPSAPCSGGQSKGPKVRVCYVCGRGYGLASYEIHLKQCKAMWEAKQQGLPASERKPLPTEPKVGVEPGQP